MSPEDRKNVEIAQMEAALSEMRAGVTMERAKIAADLERIPHAVRTLLFVGWQKSDKPPGRFRAWLIRIAHGLFAHEPS